VEGFVLPLTELKPAIVIPVYNHEHAISQTLQSVLRFGHHVLLVNDGSSKPCSDLLSALSEQYATQVSLLNLEANGGKGHAVKAGLHYLLKKEFTHALQVDADGQHNLDDIPRFINIGAKHPEVLIAGCPIYDESISKGRLYGRYLTHVWVWINTLSFTIKDSMCGFRLYPLAPTTQLLSQEPCGDRMDFDSEIIVRWVWRGWKVQNVSTKVKYPTDGVSHFNLLHDNMLISWMHTRLFFGMLIRLPKILWKKS
jgi:glycosyltransferase involved in cell wall biosynthesis